MSALSEFLTARPILTFVGIVLVMAVQLIFYMVFDNYANGGEDDDEVYSDD